MISPHQESKHEVLHKGLILVHPTQTSKVEITESQEQGRKAGATKSTCTAGGTTVHSDWLCRQPQQISPARADFGCAGLSLLLRWPFLQLRQVGLLSSCRVWASPAMEHRLQVYGLQQLWHVGSVVAAPGLWSTGSIVVVHGLICSAACWILLHQVWNPRVLHWKADSLSLSHKGRPASCILEFIAKI